MRFFTKYDKLKVTDAPIAIPSKLTRSGLSEIINHLLNSESGIESNIAFDFLIENRLLRQSTVIKLARQLNLSTESIILIEYIPAISFDDQSQGMYNFFIIIVNDI